MSTNKKISELNELTSPSGSNYHFAVVDGAGNETKKVSITTLISMIAGGTAAGSWGAASSVTISSGAVTLSTPGRYKVDTEGSAASDTLKTINGLSDGDEIILAPASSVRTVHLKRNIGNLRLQFDFPLDNRMDAARLMCDASGYLRETGGRSDNA